MANRISVWRDVEVYIDPSDFDTESLCDELESRGFTVLEATDSRNIDNVIHELYRDYIEWMAGTTNDSDFHFKVKRFFENTIDKYVM